VADSINTIRDSAITIIESITPDVESNITFRAIPHDEPIEDAPWKHTPNLSTRTFMAWPLQDPRFSQWDGRLMIFLQTLMVAVRYHVPSQVGDAYLRLMNLSGTDAARITHSLNQHASSGSWANTPFITIQAPIHEWQTVDTDRHILRLAFPVQYQLAAS
jgi:hypothetical protein